MGGTISKLTKERNKEMLIEKISNDHGIFAIWNTDKWIIYDNFWGVVAESEPVQRYVADENQYISPLDVVKITFAMPEDGGDMGLPNLIRRQIGRLEKEKMSVDEVEFEFKPQAGERRHLARYLKADTETR